MKVSAFVLTGWKVCSECLLVVRWLHDCSDLQLLCGWLAFCCSCCHWVLRWLFGKGSALVVEKSLSGLHNWRLDNVIGQ